MKSGTFQVILLIVVIILLSYNLYMSKLVTTNVKEYKTKINDIESKIDSSIDVNSNLDYVLAKLDENILSLTRDITQINKDIQIIKKNTDEKVQSIDTLNNSELEMFFAERYK